MLSRLATRRAFTSSARRANSLEVPPTRAGTAPGTANAPGAVVQPAPVVVREHVGTVGTVPVQKPVGGFRGGIFGFLLGFSAATALGVYYLQQDSKVATGLLIASVDELQGSTARITNHLDRLQTVEKDLAALRTASAVKDDVGKVRAEVKKDFDGLHLELLDLRAHVWGVEQDVQQIAKSDSIRV